MSRTNLGSISSDDIDLPSGLSWDIDVGSLNLSKATRRMYFTDSISQSGEFELDVVFTPQNVSGGDKLTITKEDQDAFYGVLSRPSKSSQGESTLYGGGAAEVLRDKPVNGEFLGYDSVDLVNEVFNQLDVSAIKVGVNEELTDGSGVVDARADDEGALTFLNRIVASHGGEWYTSYDSQNDQFEFNVVNKLESGSVQKTFTQNNTKKIEDELVLDEEYDGVIVKGYGDGDDQITGVYPERANWPSDPKILKFTDKTILSPDEATNTAESVYNKHDEWRSIYIYPSSHEELLNLGDKVDVDEPRTGVSGTYRVVARTLSLDFKEQKQVEYVLSEKPLGIIDEAENVQEQTDSQTDYMQGSRNVWGEKETRNCSDTQPLTIDVNVPQDVVDKVGNNRIQNVYANYVIKPYKQNGDPVSTATISTESFDSDTRVKTLGLNSNPRTKSLNDEDLASRNRSSTSNLDADAVELEQANLQDHNHDLSNITADAGYISAFKVGEVFMGNKDIPEASQDQWSTTGIGQEVDSDPLYININIGDSSSTLGSVTNYAVRVAIETTSGTNTYYNETITTAFNGDVQKAVAVGQSFQGQTIEGIQVDVFNYAGQGTKTVSGFVQLYAQNDHDHNIPEVTGGTAAGAVNERFALKKPDDEVPFDETVNFKSNSVTTNTDTDYIVELGENRSNTVDGANPSAPTTVSGLNDKEVFRISSIDSKILENSDFEASEVTVAVEDPDGNTTQIGTYAQQEKNRIDIKDEITGPGNYKVIFEPDTLTHLKSRVFLDHHKDSENQ